MLYAVAIVSGTLLAFIPGCSREPFTVSPPPPPPPRAVRLEFRTQPATARVNAPIPPFEVVEVDSAGAIVETAADTITLSLASPGNGRLLGGVAVAERGVARFTNVRLDDQGDYALFANARRLTADTSATFTVLPWVGIELALRGEIPTAIAGVPLTPVLEVMIRDSLGNLVTTATDAISVQLEAGSGTLGGTTTRNAVGGVARFTDLRITTAGDNYALAFTAAGMRSATSNAFKVLPPIQFQPSSIALSATSTCALDQSGAAWCWGNNVIGQLGDGRVVSNPTPIRVAGSQKFSVISLPQASGTGEHGQHGGDHDGYGVIACGLADGGEMYCWGGGPYPFTGSFPNNTKNAANPEPVTSMRFRALSTGFHHVCGLTQDGTVWCRGEIAAGWGFNEWTQVGGQIRFSKLATGRAHTCALTDAGKAYCWGIGSGGMLGDSTTVASATPVAVAGEHTFTQITLGSMHTCALDQEGEAWCWGYNSQGGLGNNGDPYYGHALAPVRVSGGRRYMAISAGAVHTCALTTDGQAWCWGANWKGQLGDGSIETRFAPVLARGDQRFTAISGGALHTCALTASGAAWCWGWSNDGQIGDGRWKDRREPVPVLGNLQFVSISAGGDATCGVTADGAGWCWGDNYAGELGDGHALYSPIPVRVSGGLTFTSLAGGGDGMCGIRSNGETWCWGTIGDSIGNRSVPVEMTGHPRFNVVSTGQSNGCGIAPGGEGLCWGWGPGNGTAARADRPVPISGGLTLAAVTVGYHFCAITTEGDPYCWGSWQGPPGVDGSRPALVGGGLKFVTVTGGWDHDCGLTAAGKAYCWGANNGGQLGDGTRTPSPVPVAVVGDHQFTNISANNSKTCGVTLAGTGYCWAFESNSDGADTPQQVPGGLTFAHIVLSNSWGGHACGITTNGAIYCWGPNSKGQLGNGSIDFYTPVTLPTLVVGGLTARHHMAVR